MATHTTTLARNIAVSAGTTTYGGASGFAVAAGVLTATLDTAGEAPGIDFVMDVLYTQDGGATWHDWAAIEFSSDPATDKQGQPITTRNLGGSWPGTRLRAILTVSADTTISLSATLVT
jgi:hypothetical protein